MKESDMKHNVIFPNEANDIETSALPAFCIKLIFVLHSNTDPLKIKTVLQTEDIRQRQSFCLILVEGTKSWASSRENLSSAFSTR